MRPVALLTPDPAYAGDDPLWQTVLARLQRALEAVGIGSAPMPWTAHADDAAALRDYACVLPLLAWGYHRDGARWQRACATWQRAGLPVANPAPVLAWNSDKRYLRELAERGVAIPPTVFAEALTPAAVAQAFAATGASELIVKPAVSGGAWNTRRLRRGDPLPPDDGGAVLLQAYLPSIETDGETSLLFFGGHFSHAVCKRPAPGDFRVQEEFGGRYRPLARPAPEALALAGQVLEAVAAPLLYARIDLVPDADGRWRLMEAELIEPDFYLDQDPAQGAGFARALRAYLAAADAAQA
ncbi:ATP-grasp domain-containing protein [Thermomonas flagellata]|uniref:ATP-grasp domain-containing protein n=1 Tax=Thermomonas flagellata TaxID=2888524 RepID=UPI0023D8EC2C|nr:hypothetical protein [Thermomonas flagellata]